MGRESLFRSTALKVDAARLTGSVALKLPNLYKQLVLLIVFFLCLLLIFGTFGEFSRRQTAIGQVVPVSGMVRVWPKSVGVISDLEVAEGQSVVKGQILALIATGKALSGGEQFSEERRGQIQLTIDSVREGILTEKRHNLVEQKRIGQRDIAIQKELSDLLSELKLEKQQLVLVSDDVDRLTVLLEKGYISKMDYQKKQQAVIDATLRVKKFNRVIDERKQEQRDLVAQLELIAINKDIKVAELKGKLIQLKGNLIEMDSQQSYALTAPATGRIVAIQKKVGQRLTLSQPFAAIVPENVEFEVELFVPSRAIGFLEAGEAVQLRYQAFPFQRYGIHKGTVTDVAYAGLHADDLGPGFGLSPEPHYRVDVAIEEQYLTIKGKQIPLRPGMLVEADVILDTLPVWHWLFEPVLSLKGQI